MQTAQYREEQKVAEIGVVGPTNTMVDPWAVMVHFFNTAIACKKLQLFSVIKGWHSYSCGSPTFATVMRTRRLVALTLLAVLQPLRVLGVLVKLKYKICVIYKFYNVVFLTAH